MKSTIGVIGAALVLVIAGCATSSAARIQEKAALFATLTADEQESIRNGRIESGFTAEMVYMALGRPSRTESAPPWGETWTYRNFYSGEQRVYDDTGSGEAPARDMVIRFQNHRVTSFKLVGG